MENFTIPIIGGQHLKTKVVRNIFMIMILAHRLFDVNEYITEGIYFFSTIFHNALERHLSVKT